VNRRRYPGFGWPEWPQDPYLSIAAEKRQERLQELLQPPSDYALIQTLKPLLSYLGSCPLIITQMRPNVSETEWVEANRALWRIYHPEGNSAPIKTSQTGRAAQKAVWPDRLRFLTVHRLLHQYRLSAKEAFGLLIDAFGSQCPYSNDRALYNAAEKAANYIKKFNRKILVLSKLDYWHFPFYSSLLETIKDE
jgi:hypothetical protein